jgi:hypothetical protein
MEPISPVSNPSACSNDIKEAVQRFLTTWYVDRDFVSLLDFVAKDNVYNAANLENLGVKSPAALWSRLFSDAFESSSARVAKLQGPLQYHEPDFDEPDIKLRYINSEAVKSGAAAYAIIEPDSLPSGSLFAPSQATDVQRSRWNLQAKFLDYLREAYRSKLYVVIYSVTAPGLVHETVIQYWVKEGDCWKISAFQGTDW